MTRRNWIRLQKCCLAMACGGTMPGFLQGLGLVNFASLFTSFLATWLAVIATAIFGGDPSAIIGNTGGGF